VLLEPLRPYVLGRVAAPKLPDLAIELTWTWGGLDKLEIYSKLGVPEVWYWDAGSKCIGCAASATSDRRRRASR
jgi:hypothetical protein